MNETATTKLRSQLEQLFTEVASPNQFWKPADLHRAFGKHADALAADSRSVKNASDADAAVDKWLGVLVAQADREVDVDKVVAATPRDI